MIIKQILIALLIIFSNRKNVFFLNFIVDIFFFHLIRFVIKRILEVGSNF